MSRSVRFTRASALLALLGVVMLAACGSSDDTSATQTTQSSGGTSGGSSPSTTAKPAQNFDRSKGIVLAYPTPAVTLDPGKITVTAQFSYVAPMYDRLTQFSFDSQVKPMLATSWTFSPDGKSLTLKLRSGVTFPDGTPLDAEAVKANLDRYRTLEGGSQKIQLQAITATTVTDPTTLTLTLGIGGAELPVNFATGAGMIINPKVLADPAVNLAASPPANAGSGPYTLSSYTPGSSIKYTRSTRPYWEDGTANFATIEFRTVADPAALQAGVRTGELNAGILTGGAIQDGENLAKQGAFVADLIHTASINSLMFVPGRPKLADLRVRQAITYAIDYTGIATGLTGGSCTLTTQLAEKSSPTYNASLPDKKQDFAKAKQLLADAGVSNLSLDMVYAASGTYFGATAQAIQQNLKDIGITANVTGIPPADLTTRVAQRAVDLAVYPISAQPHDIITVRQFLLGNFKLVADADLANIQSLADKAINPGSDEATRNKAFGEIWKANYDNIWDQPICGQGNQWIHHKDLVGFDSMPFSKHSGFDIRYMGWAAR